MRLYKIKNDDQSYLDTTIKSKIIEKCIFNFSIFEFFNNFIKISVGIIIYVTASVLNPAIAQSQKIELNLKCNIEGKEISISGTKPLGTTSVIAKILKFDNLFISVNGNKLNLVTSTISHVNIKSVDRSEDGIFWIYQISLDSTGSTETDIKINRTLGTIETSEKFIFNSGPSWINIWTGLCSSISKEQLVF